MNWYVTGDMHGETSRLMFLKYEPEDSSAIIVLGDLGINFYLDKKEHSKKTVLNSYHNYIYAVRGNHEERPENLPNHSLIYDENVKGYVWCDKIRYPYIRYFVDGAVYEIDTLKTLILGGAYSVDKPYRVAMNYQWFPQEQLSQKEMNKILAEHSGQSYDVILSHTCPYSWEPRDLFLSMIDQSNVDDTMEHWMDKVKNEIGYKLWLFGHFHDDRIVRPHVEMFYTDISKLNDVYSRWNNNNSEEIPSYWNYDKNFSAPDNIWKVEYN